jgi:protocatechuate 3,4-dioxygenase alpha subunit
MTDTPKQTPSQTVGPYFAYGLTPEQYGYDFPQAVGADLRGEGCTGEAIRIEGRVLDGENTPVDDAMIEIWQADDQGRYPGTEGANTGFAGFGRAGTGADPENLFRFETVKPGATADGAPHINVIVTMRGLLNHLFTRIYFADEVKANEADPLLQAVPEERRHTLIAERHDAGDEVVYRFDIHMQGAAETVFLDL